VIRETLNQALTRLGYTTRPGRLQYTKEILNGGELAFTGTAYQAWEWLRGLRRLLA